MLTFKEIAMDDLVCFEFQGRLDSAGTDAIEVPFTAKVRAATNNVLVDLTAVPFVGSLGIRMLIAAARIVQRSGRKLMVMGVQPPVRDVFDTVALTDMIPIVADVHEAGQHSAV